MHFHYKHFKLLPALQFCRSVAPFGKGQGNMKNFQLHWIFYTTLWYLFRPKIINVVAHSFWNWWSSQLLLKLTESPPTLDCKSETAEWNLLSAKDNFFSYTKTKPVLFMTLVDFSLVFLKLSSFKLQKVPTVLCFCPVCSSLSWFPIKYKIHWILKWNTAPLIFMFCSWFESTHLTLTVLI